MYTNLQRLLIKNLKSNINYSTIYTIEELVAWIPKLKEWDEYRIDMTERDTVPKATAKKLWPEWYEYRINQGKSSKWSVKRDLYDWWKGKII